MSTISELLSARTTSGARYLAAAVEIRAAYIELASLDRALVNANLGPVAQSTALGMGGNYAFGAFQTVASFGPLPDVIPLRHPQYAPATPAGNMADEINAAASVIVNAFTRS